MSKKFIQKIALLLCLSYMTSCASIMGSSGPQTVPITTQPEGATIEILDIKNQNTSILKTQSPSIATLQRSAGYFSAAKYKLKITKDGYMPVEKDIETSLSGWYFGNIIFGGIIGILLIDPATGAMWTLGDQKVNIKLYSDNLEGKREKAKDRCSVLSSLDLSSALPDERKQAFDELNTIITTYPDVAEAYTTRAQFYEYDSKYTNALDDLNKSINCKASVESYKLRAVINERLDKRDEAKADLKKACELGDKESCSQI